MRYATRGLLGFLLLLFVPPIQAQDTTSVKDSLVQALAESEGYEIVGGTLIQVEVDPITDATKAMAMVPSDDLSRTGGGAIMYRCTDEELEVFVNAGEYLGDDDRDVIYRFDDREPQEESWSISTSGSAVFADDDRQFAVSSAQSEKVAFRVFDYDGTPHTLEFELEGTGQALQKLPCLTLEK